jgi:hypothetical protein
MTVFDPELAQSDVICYLDDSGTDHKTVDHAVLGGVVFNRSHFEAFDEHWTDLMHRFGVEQPFHMRDLTPHGRLSHITGCRRWCLINEVVAAIQFFKIHTLVVSVNNLEHQKHLSDKMQRAMRVYRLAFMAAAVSVHQIATEQNYNRPVAFVLDAGTKYRGQVLETHRHMQADGEHGGWHLGPLRFENDRFVTALQAADVVSWTRRRLDAGLPIPDDFNALPQVVNDNFASAVVTDNMLRELNERLDRFLTDKGWPVDRPRDAG